MAEELGKSRTTFWMWSNDVKFILYKEELADECCGIISI
ncbi:hypothetical protein [Bacillus wiedmannii]